MKKRNCSFSVAHYCIADIGFASRETQMSGDVRKLVFGVLDKVSHKPTCTVSEKG